MGWCIASARTIPSRAVVLSPTSLCKHGPDGKHDASTSSRQLQSPWISLCITEDGQQPHWYDSFDQCFLMHPEPNALISLFLVHTTSIDQLCHQYLWQPCVSTRSYCCWNALIQQTALFPSPMECIHIRYSFVKFPTALR